MGALAGISFVEIEVAPRSGLGEKPVRDLSLPKDRVLATILRDGRIIIPRGNSLLRVGDLILALTTQENESTLRAYLKGEA